MWNKKKVSVVLPIYNEEKNIGNAIQDFFSIGIVDEIIAVDNNSTDNSKSEILRTNATYVGLKEARGDYIITAEPDGTFLAKDIFKLLHYSDDFDAVLGTRTSKALIWTGAKMDWFLRLGNEFVAKLLEYIHNGPCLTDVGCTLKLIKKASLQKIQNQFTVGKSHFSPEFIILCLKNNIKTVEVPVNYAGRIGQSKITNTFWKSFKLGLIMIGLIIKHRFKKTQ
jgi:glycosyltransferase involved in cell wall biosynthesis